MISVSLQDKVQTLTSYRERYRLENVCKIAYQWLDKSFLGPSALYTKIAKKMAKNKRAGLTEENVTFFW